MIVPTWFNESVYMANKLAQLQANDPNGNWTAAKLSATFVGSGIVGKEGAYTHFLQFGQNEDVSPNATFIPTEYYASKAAEFFKVSPASNVSQFQIDSMKSIIKQNGSNAWNHYQHYGTVEGINPSNAFDTDGYMTAKLQALQLAEPTQNWTATKLEATFKAAGISALEHYLTFGNSGLTGEISQAQYVAGFPVPPEKQVPSTKVGQTYTLTTATDNIVGTAYDDTIIGVFTGSDATTTINPGDQINGGAGTDTLKLTVTGTGNVLNNATISNVEHINVNNANAKNDNVTLDLTKVAGVNQVTLSGNGSTNIINLKDAQLNVNGVGTKSDSTTISFDADTSNVKMNLQGTSNNITLKGDGLETFVVQGSANSTINLEPNPGSSTATFKTFDAGLVTGNLDLDLTKGSFAKDLTLLTGSGNDFIKMNFSDLSIGDNINTGLGTDTINFQLHYKDTAQNNFSVSISNHAILNDTAYSALNNIKGLEVLDFSLEAVQGSNNVLTGVDFNTSKITSVSNFNVQTDANISGILSGQNISTSNKTESELTLNMATAAEAGSNATGIINFAANTANTTTTINNTSIFSNLVLSGAGNIYIDDFTKADGFKAIQSQTGVTVNGSKMTGNLGVTGSTFADVITGGSGQDTIGGGGGQDTLTGGDGKDLFDITLNKGNDTNTFDSIKSNMATITDLNKIDSLKTVTTETKITTQQTEVKAADLDSTLKSLLESADRSVTSLTCDGYTYLVVNENNSGYDGDQVVKIQGTIDFSTAHITDGVISW